MRCLSEVDFHLLYKKGDQIGSGSYGEVYKTKNNKFIVKRSPSDLNTSFIREVVFLSQLNHPNIMHIEDISFGDDFFYFSQPLGVPLKEAFDNGLLSVRDIVSDLFSAVAYLYVNGIAHRDLKHLNLVYHEGRVKIIDFGLAAFAEFVINAEGKEDLMITGPAYTEPYRDPEYSFDRMNSINVELYSILMTVYFMFDRNWNYGKRREYYIGLNQLNRVGIKDPDMQDLLMRCQSFLDERQNILELFDHPALDRSRMIEPECVDKIRSTSKDLNEVDFSKLKIANDWIIDVCFENKVSVRIVLNALALMTSLFQKNIKSICQKLGFKRYPLNLQAVACAVLYLSINLESEMSILRMVHLSGNVYDINQIKRAICLVITETEGKILMDTCYESIRTYGDMRASISVALERKYDSKSCYALDFLIKEDEEPFNRYFWGKQHHFPLTLAKGFKQSRSTHVVECSILPIIFEEEYIDIETEIVKLDKTNPDYFLELVYYITHYRDQLPGLSLSVSRQVVEALELNMKYANGALYDRFIPVRYKKLELIPENIFGMTRKQLEDKIEEYIPL